MFELNYEVTSADMKAVNKKNAMFYFWLYIAVAIVGIAVGIVAVILHTETFMFVLGILILVIAGILAVCALLLLIAPKTLLTSAVPVDKQMTVVVDKNGITVDGEPLCPFADVLSVKNKKDYLLVTVAKDKVVVVKNPDGTLDELYAYMSERKGRLLLDPQADAPQAQSENTDESAGE